MYKTITNMSFALLLALLLAFLMPASRVAATLVIDSIDTTKTINFDTTVDDVNNGAWAGAGFQPSPSTGQLDSSSWAVTGFDAGDLSFEGTRTTASTDYTRGAVTAAIATNTGGLYSRTNTATGRALWIQPGGSDFTPGTLTLRVKNQTGSASSSWDISYLIYNLNDQARSNSFNFSSPTDALPPTTVSGLNFSSPEASDTLGVISTARSTSIPISVQNNGFFYLRWSGDDISGSNNRDEFGLDNIAISMSAVPEPAAVLFGGLVCGVLGLTVAGRRALVWLQGKNLNAAVS